MRLFFAVELSPGARRLLESALREFAASGADAKWVTPDAMHLTLAFLGEVRPERLDSLRGAASRAAAGKAAYKLSLSGLGAFPSWKAARVVWAGIDAGADATKRLADDLRAALKEEGFPVEEREFVPHATIGRLRSSRKLESLAAAAQAWARGPQARWEQTGGTVDAFALVQSTLTPRGPRYEDVARFSLSSVPCA